MTRVLVVVTGLVLAVGSVRPSCQAHPDFSGYWQQHMELSSKTSLQSYANRIEHQGDTLKVTTMTGGSRGENSFDKTYVIGKETTSADREGDQLTSIVRWEGAALVFVTTEKDKSGTIETRETWTLSANGKTLTKERRSHGPRGDNDQHYILEKSAQ
jgi:hypothetical protein